MDQGPFIVTKQFHFFYYYHHIFVLFYRNGYNMEEEVIYLSGYINL